MTIIDAANFEFLYVHSPLSIVVVVSALAGLYTSWLALSRLYLSPIAKFPGPKLAALTLWYQFYFDVYLGGQYTFEIERMHAKYGPIVRINPYELHIIDSDFYETLYGGGGSRRNRWEWSSKSFAIPNSVFGTVEHDLHRKRRAILNPYFSKRSVTKVEPIIQHYIGELCARFREFQKTKEPLNLNYAFGALTIDVITEYCFGQSYDSTNDKNFDPRWLDMTNELSKGAHFMNQFGFLLPVMQAMPDWLQKKLNKQMGTLVDFQADMRRQVTEVKTKSEKDPSSISRDNIFWVLLNSDTSPSEKSTQRLMEEGQILVGAGQLTTADTLAITPYFLLTNLDKMKLLKDELIEAIPNPQNLPSSQTLEQLPYLTAVVLEGLRITIPVMHRLQRCAPDDALQYGEWTIPPGTVMSMSQYFVHRDERYFPDPDKFMPERWLDVNDRRRLERYLVAFGKGGRMCLGSQLAMSELYCTFAAIIRRFEMELYDTTEKDIKITVDWFNPYTKKGPRQVKVFVK